ncbi:hypothetical protein [Jeotgalibacillus haloalkalitolerans]|uniref:DUF4825 domain-containing protein n=1 Tax=Jeotgalibacillus haloalkalitolerans TaxID=3104292 RepID=A0ABU5KP60_9BACL|nr:hypothetical protein [Jeotgalibacillus sp. HH7-29]MDZ5712751.1 hypothetical protein [Jeotgalibacillus sp. HH7-29]
MKNKKNLIRLVVSLFLILSITLNIFLFRQNLAFQAQQGSYYIRTVNNSLFDLETSPDDWVSESAEGSFPHAFSLHQGKLQSQSVDYDFMNGKVSVIGNQFTVLSRQYAQLEKQVSEDGSISAETLNECIANYEFLREALMLIDDSLDEEPVSWYQELSDPGSALSEDIWSLYKDYEERLK